MLSRLYTSPDRGGGVQREENGGQMKVKICFEDEIEVNRG